MFPFANSKQQLALARFKAEIGFTHFIIDDWGDGTVGLASSPSESSLNCFWVDPEGDAYFTISSQKVDSEILPFEEALKQFKAHLRIT